MKEDRGFYTGTWWGKMIEKDNLEDLELNGSVILEYFIKKRDWRLDWIDLA